MANLHNPGHQLAGDFFIWNGVLVEKGYSSEKILCPGFEEGTLSVKTQRTIYNCQQEKFTK